MKQCSHYRLLELILSELQTQTKLISQRKETEKSLLIVDKLKDRLQQLKSSKNLGMTYNVTHDDLINEFEDILNE